MPALGDHVDGHQDDAEDLAGDVAEVVEHVDEPHLDGGELAVELVASLDEEEVLSLQEKI